MLMVLWCLFSENRGRENLFFLYILLYIVLYIVGAECMGNAYDYAFPVLIICNDNGCHRAEGEELESIINEITMEIIEKLYLGKR